MNLILSVRFLDDRYHGTVDSGERREWPPSPFRLFQAIVAGNAIGQDLPDDLAVALQWLERLDPPVITAPAGRPGTEILTYVLNNVSDTNPNSRAPKMIRPTVFGDDRLVEYIWSFQDSADAQNYARTIVRASHRIRALGWGIDLAIGDGQVVNSLPSARSGRIMWRPMAPGTGGFDLRCPSAGSLQSLRDVYADFVRRYETPGVTRLESAGAIYQPVTYTDQPARHFCAFELVDDEEVSVAVRPMLIAPLVGILRSLCQSPDVVRRLGKEVVDRDILGHPAGSPNRVSICPIPTTRNGPTDGKVRRVLFVQPPASDGAIVNLLGLLLNGRALQPESGEARFPIPIRLRLLRYSDAVVNSYRDRSSTWASVTPVLLPGYDDRRQHRGDHLKRMARSEQLLRKALAQSDLPDPAEIELARVPFVSGASHTHAYPPQEKLQHYPRFHVRLRFDRQLTGPLAIGAGRHAGFGTLVSCS